MIKYIGSKRTLVPAIAAAATALPGARTACDLFTGTTRVAQGLKQRGLEVIANDVAAYSLVFARTYIEADAREVDMSALEAKLSQLRQLPGKRGYVTRTFCEQSRFFQPHNGRRIDAVREGIDMVAETESERAILLTSLLEAADRVDSTTGLQMAYLKQWAARSHNELDLRMPQLLEGGGLATQRDANQLAAELDDVDVCYLDPPYNQHSYRGNYHVWETLVRNDAPTPYGKACKRIDCRTHKSPYNSARLAWAAFSELIETVTARDLIVSFSDEGFFTFEQIHELLSQRGFVAAVQFDSKRYVGAQIGIHDPRGHKVGKVSHLRNTEYLFVVTAARAQADEATRASVRAATASSSRRPARRPSRARLTAASGR